MKTKKKYSNRKMMQHVQQEAKGWSAVTTYIAPWKCKNNTNKKPNCR